MVTFYRILLHGRIILCLVSSKTLDIKTGHGYGIKSPSRSDGGAIKWAPRKTQTCSGRQRN